jgi:hypothetical protein
MARIIIAGLMATVFIVSSALASEPEGTVAHDDWFTSLITDTPAEGFELAVRLARRGVTTTQPDREVLMRERDKYAEDGKDLIAVSHVVAVHYQTIAAANDYWRD